jgi:NADPH2:quinone reductase
MTIAIAISRAGGPDELKPVEVHVAEPGPGEVRVRQSVVGVNYVDIYFRSGLYQTPLPSVLGVEGAGIVEATGAGVARLRPGDRVAYVGAPVGAYAEIRLLPENRLVKLPNGVSERVAGSSIARGLTAQMLLRKVYPVKSGDWILVHAAAGGLGQFVTRWAKRLGGHVIGTVGSKAKIAAARDAGADEVLLHTDRDWVDQARRLANDKGAHFAIDGIGGAMLAQTLGAVRPFGLVASVGQPAGRIPPIEVEDLGPRRSLGLARPSVMAYSSDPEFYQSGAAEVLAVLQDGLVNPIGAEYPLRDAAKAHAALEAGKTTGSVILTV